MNTNISVLLAGSLRETRDGERRERKEANHLDHGSAHVKTVTNLLRIMRSLP
jgi:hypothetical protein